ncbi:MULTISPECIES: four-carbon acid sugar kinase family protein [unclassified Microbacterium]|uniref:four-carbon acid sugar kinase family protein n=1 Tax=unclassified Microbacterium TaxID=2609290 RepID=UPI00200676D4|nr:MULTISPECIES: four-carbon acid sugar kinase family protein [unclassified Microbacterium]
MAELAFYGDDVTGSVDVLLQAARLGRTGRLFVGRPSASDLRGAAQAVDVVGVAGIGRSLPTLELDAEVRPALTALRDAGAPVVQYKACSTADSSPAIGSLGRVLEIGREVFGEAPVPLLFAQPDFGRFTAFGTHFAAENGTVHRLDRQPTMSAHPSTPIDEADLARFLARQTALPIGSVPFTDYTSTGVLRDRIRDASEAALVLDALDDDHLAVVGAAVVAGSPAPGFVLGSGGLTRALLLARPGSGQEDVGRPAASGPVLVVSGSRSPATRRQFDAAVAAGWSAFRLAPGVRDDVRASLRAGRSVALTADDDALTFGGREPVEAIARAAASAVRDALDDGLTRRVVVSGGDTSSRVVRMLGVTSLSLAARLGGNVVLLRAHSDDAAVDGVELLLKGGQVGADDLFETVRRAGS